MARKRMSSWSDYLSAGWDEQDAHDQALLEQRQQDAADVAEEMNAEHRRVAAAKKETKAKADTARAAKLKAMSDAKNPKREAIKDKAQPERESIKDREVPQRESIKDKKRK